MLNLKSVACLARGHPRTAGLPMKGAYESMLRVSSLLKASMRVNFTVTALSMACLLASTANAASFDFSITYQGGGVAVVDPGSDTPDGTVLFEGDSFTWSLHTDQSHFWRVIEGGGLFPLMAFGVDEPATRTGTYQLLVRNDGMEVFSFNTTDEQSEVHVGTNTITLATGLEFDELFLSYTLDAVVPIVPDADDEFSEDEDIAVLPLNAVSASTTIRGSLPIFGAPELAYSQNIEYVAAIPEPETYMLMLLGLGVVGAAFRGRTLHKSQ